MREVKSWFGGFTNKIFGRRKKAQNEESVQEQTEQDVQRNAEVAREVVNNDRMQQEVSHARHVDSHVQQHSQSGNLHQYDLHENQIDSNLGQMASGLSRLKNMGLSLGTELDNQSAQLNRLGGKMEGVNTRTGKINSELRRLNK